MNSLSPELEDWEEIIELAGGDNTPSQGKASAKSAQKSVLATASLGHAVFDMQTRLSQRLDTLNERLAESAKSSDRLSKWTIGLTIALVFATLVQAGAAIATLIKH